MSDPNLGWHPDTRCYILLDSSKYVARPNPRRLIADWGNAGFSHTWGHGETTRRIDFRLIRRRKNYLEYLLIYPLNEAAELWLLINAPSYH